MVSIDKSQVPADKLTDVRLFEAERQLLVVQNDPVKRRASCTHESGHERYCRKYGIETKWVGPSIGYIPRDESHKECFVPIRAAIQPDTTNILNLGDGCVSMMLAAGYAAECALCNKPFAEIEAEIRNTKFDTGSDFSHFVMLSKNKDFSEKAATIFLQIIEIVISEMQDPHIRDEIRRIAEDFEKQIFTDPFQAPITGGSVPQS
jgi:hypothetical protein